MFGSLFKKAEIPFPSLKVGDKVMLKDDVWEDANVKCGFSYPDHSLNTRFKTDVPYTVCYVEKKSSAHPPRFFIEVNSMVFLMSRYAIESILTQ